MQGYVRARARAGAWAGVEVRARVRFLFRPPAATRDATTAGTRTVTTAGTRTMTTAGTRTMTTCGSISLVVCGARFWSVTRPRCVGVAGVRRQAVVLGLVGLRALCASPPGCTGLAVRRRPLDLVERGGGGDGGLDLRDLRDLCSSRASWHRGIRVLGGLRELGV